MRTPFIAANWKMYKTVSEAVVFAKELRADVKDIADVEIVIAPPFTAIHPVAEALRNSNIGVAAQNMSWEREGAFTGDVSAGMIKEAGAEYVIIGHSERRRLFGETDAVVNRKLVAAYAAGLWPIMCVGETLDERERSQTMQVVSRQLTAVLDLAGAPALRTAVIAYEPVWAIGTGKNATPAQAQEVHAHIRAAIAGRDAKIAADVRILYGGSVKAANAHELFAMPDVDGGLVGGASLKADEFLKICACAQTH